MHLGESNGLPSVAQKASLTSIVSSWAHFPPTLHKHVAALPWDSIGGANRPLCCKHVRLRKFGFVTGWFDLRETLGYPYREEGLPGAGEWFLFKPRVWLDVVKLCNGEAKCWWLYVAVHLTVGYNYIVYRIFIFSSRILWINTSPSILPWLWWWFQPLYRENESYQR